jgi:hypothetical protein
MAGAFPTSQGFTAINFKSNTPTLTTETVSGISFRRQISSQRWEFTLSLPPMTRAEFAPVYAFMIKQKGSKESFTVVAPEISSTRGTEDGTVLVNGSHTAGDTTIDIDGLNSGLKAGDLIKFASHQKVYMVIDDANADSNGEATITIEPPLRENLANDEAITYNNVPITVRAVNDIQEFQLGNDPVYRIEIDVVEDLN